MATFSALSLLCPVPDDRQFWGLCRNKKNGPILKGACYLEEYEEREGEEDGLGWSLTWRHELPQLLRHDDALLCLVVLQEGADGASSGAHCSVEHMDKLHLRRRGPRGSS